MRVSRGWPCDPCGRLAAMEEFHVAMCLEPGDMQFLHNHQIMHARDAFRDSDTARRHLLRLWLSVDDHEGGCATAEGQLGSFAAVAPLCEKGDGIS